MNHYVDIVIKSDAEMRENLLLNKVYTKFHKVLCDQKSTGVGVSFPRYKIMLGDVIRLHGTETKLAELQALDWLGGLKGYCTISSIQAIPENVTYRNISRIQSNMTEAKLRRLIKRGSITQEETKAYKAKMFQQGMDNPYLELESGSNGHKHRRYLQFGELSLQSVKGEFDQFGLSKTATVPWF
ncbi:MAG: type I-F CRISPR-associated endoribonuclease Cas6/Csy4 [Gammaproteobacteria bacterium]|nr:MAG: type I-F CRISPR-associated endoribonuclease Cas6/Csy4 [Gammaproteobacteria bacterium]